MAQQETGPAMPRRDFLKVAAGATTAAVTSSLWGYGVFAQGADRIRVGLIGCGGRGTGAAHNCAAAGDGIEVYALGDLFADRLNGCFQSVTEKLGEKATVTQERCFSGFDAYQKVIDSGVDLVILATPPGFRPQHFKAAIDAGKHVFMEKPVAVCPAGIRQVLAAGEIATERKLGVVAGTQRRHQNSYVETVKRLRDGAIGKVLAAQCYWNQGGLWKNDPRPEWSDVEWQIRNWLYFTWLSGDHIVEQHVHNMDVVNWVLGAHPEKCVSLGGRQVRTDPSYGEIYDHFANDFEYPDGVRVLSMCRQIDGCTNRVDEFVIGAEGVSAPGGWIRSAQADKSYRHQGGNDPYTQEHIDLIASIRAGTPINETQNVAESTLCAIMARMSAYTGQEVTWDFVMTKSQLNLMRDIKEFGDLPVEPVAMPGQTPLV